MLLYKMHRITNGTWLSVPLCLGFVNNDQGAGHLDELASMNQADPTGGQTFSNALHEGV